jgi:hypothetical protein
MLVVVVLGITKLLVVLVVQVELVVEEMVGLHHLLDLELLEQTVLAVVEAVVDISAALVSLMVLMVVLALSSSNTLDQH